MTAVREFTPEIGGQRAARRFLHDQLVDWGAEELDEPAQLILAELSANVIRHAQTDFAVRIDWAPPALRIEVSDGSSIVPAIKDLADEHGGLGLRIVDSLADEWGIEQHEDGKAVWFVLNG